VKKMRRAERCPPAAKSRLVDPRRDAMVGGVSCSSKPPRVVERTFGETSPASALRRRSVVSGWALRRSVQASARAVRSIATDGRSFTRSKTESSTRTFDAR